MAKGARRAAGMVDASPIASCWFEGVAGAARELLADRGRPHAAVAEPPPTTGPIGDACGRPWRGALASSSLRLRSALAFCHSRVRACRHWHAARILGEENWPRAHSSSGLRLATSAREERMLWREVGARHRAVAPRPQSARPWFSNRDNNQAAKRAEGMGPTAR